MLIASKHLPVLAESDKLNVLMFLISPFSLLFESPCLFMCATLLPVHDGIASSFELDTTIRSATGCMVSSLNHLKDLNDESGAFFVFPDISVRVDGVYRFRMTLFEITG